MKIIFIFDVMQLYYSQEIDQCTEQWNVVSLEKDQWELVGDVSYKDNFSFYRDPNQKTLVSDVGGAAWYKINKNNMSGVKFVFTPQITIDMNYYGNVKYPQGFALVFTASPIKSLLGEKRSGLGYDGIQGAVAFEWDFLQNADKNDIRDPHFSAHYNLKGPISSASPKDCKGHCNVRLSNFYDFQKVGFNKEVEYTLEIFGGFLNLYENGAVIIKNVEFPHLDQLMEENEIYFGITSAMNLYKVITLKNFRMYKIANSDKPSLNIANPKESYDAGKPLLANFYINSICGKHLKIFPQQFTKLFSFKMNNQPWDQNISISFDKKSYSLAIQIRDLNKAGKVTLTPSWKGVEGNNNEISIVPGEVTKYDICDPSYDRKTNVLKTAGKFIGKTFSFTICTTDQYKNPKVSKHMNDDQLVKIEYPYLIPPTENLRIESNQDKSQYKITVPLTGLGVYTIYNEQFFNGVRKTFEVLMGNADAEHSYAEISNYFENRIAKTNSQIILYIHLRDSYGNIIPNDKFSQLKCTFDSSVVEHTFQGEKKTYDFQFPGGNIPIVDNYPALTYTPQNPGEYIFRPRVKCGIDKNPTDIRCDLCTFYLSTQVPDTSRFKLFSDFKNTFLLSNDAKPLYISLDEYKNRKITSIRFVDTSGMEIKISNIDIANVKVDLESNGKITKINPVFNPSGSIDLFIESGKDRTTIFSPLNVYYMTIKITDNQYKLNSDVIVPIQFAFKDDYLNNVNPISQQDVPMNSIINYMPGSLTIRAAHNQLLFKLIARNANYEMTMAESIDKTKISVNVVDSEGVSVDFKATVIKTGIFHYISASPTKAGQYNVDLMYDGKKIQSYPIKVIPRNEVFSLRYDNKSPVIKTIDTNNIILKTAKVGESVSFQMTMHDEFGNLISDNYLAVFNSISIKTSGDISVNPLFGGSLTVVSKEKQPGVSRLTLTLSNNLEYKIELERTSTEIDPIQSSSELVMKGLTTVGTQIQVKISLADTYGNEITKFLKTNEELLKNLKENLIVYLLGPENAVVSLQYSSITEDNKVLFTTPEGKTSSITGEYNLNVYYNNVYVLCSLCYVNLSPLSLDLTNTSAYMIGSRSDRKLYTDQRYQLVSSKENIVFYLIFKDKLGNELNNSESQYEIFLINEEEKTSLVKFCKISQENKKRQYYQFCSSDDLDIFSKLKRGKYFVKIDENMFKFFIDETYFESTEAVIEPSATNSYIRNEDSIVTGSSDSPARIVIDFRSEKFLRYQELDVSKITVTSDNVNFSDISVKFLYGPIKGLMTALVSTQKVGNAKLTIKYADKVVITNVNFTNTSGKLDSIQFLDKNSKKYSNGKYYFFQLLDIGKANCGFISLGNTIVREYLIETFSIELNKHIIGYQKYNPFTGIYSIQLESSVIGELKIASPFILEPLSIQSVKNYLNVDKSFAYLEDDSDALVNSKTVLNFQPLDSQRNDIPAKEVQSETTNFSVIITNTENDSTNYVATVLATFTEEKGIFFEYTFTRPGDYLFIPLYNGYTIECNLCRKRVQNDVVSLANTSIQVKTANGWNDKTNAMTYKLFQNTYPVFKVILKDKFNSQLNTLTLSNYVFDLIVDNGNVDETLLKVKVFLSSRNGVFVYLSEEGRKSYLNLNPLTKLKLRIKDRTTNIEFTNFIVLNSEKQNQVSQSSCANDAVPTFENLSNQILKAGGDLMLEFNLKGCLTQEQTLFDNDEDFVFSTTVANISSKVIPAEANGKYIIILTSRITTKEDASVSLKFKDSQNSISFKINVVPDYSLGKLSFTSAGSFTSSETHALFYMTAYDSYQNILSGENTMFFYTDIYFDLVNSNNRKIPYKVTYSASKNAFVVQFPIITWDNYTVKSRFTEAPFVVTVKPGLDLYQSHAEVTKSDGTDLHYDVKVTLRDIKFKNFSDDDNKLIDIITLKYYTYNTITGEEVLANLTDVKLKESSILSVVIPSDLPKYQITSIIPYSTIFPISCQGCLMINKDIRFAYSFQTDDKYNRYFTLSLDSSYFFVNTNQEQLLFLYESSTEVPASIQSFELASFSYNIGALNGKLTFVGMDTLERNNQVINGLNEIKLGNGINSQIFFDYNQSKSNNDAEASNTRVYSRKTLTIRAGEKAYFFLEVRDRDNKITTKNPLVSLTADDIKFNLIKSSYPGVFLIEIIIETISKYKSFKVKINNKETSINIGLISIPSFPINLDVNTQQIIDWSTVQYNIVSFDIFNNLVCDERLGLVGKLNNEILEKDIFYDDSSKSCNVLFYFSGYANLTSHLFKSGSKMIIENLGQARVSPFASSLILDQNNNHNGSPIVVTLKLISSTGFVFPSDTTKSGIVLRVYSMIGYNLKKLVREILGVNSLINSYSMETLGITYGDYLITAEVDGAAIQDFSPFKYYKSNIQNPDSIQVNLRLALQWRPLDKIYDVTNINYEKIQLPYPFSLMMNFINSETQKISIPINAVTEVSLFLDSLPTRTKIFDFEGIRNSETSYLIEVPKDKVNTYLHLPEGNYVVSFKSTIGEKKIEKFIYLAVTQGLFQKDNLIIPYHLPGTEISDTLDIIGTDNERVINTNVGSYSITNLCLKSGDKIYNDYLDPDKFQVRGLDANVCNLYNSISLRGCIEFNMKCSKVAPSIEGYKVRVAYNLITLSSQLTIFIDPQLPPASVEVITPFPSKVEQKSEILSQFNLVDKDKNIFKYVNTDNFEVYVNNIQLASEKWKLFFNKNLQLKLLNVDYPPRKQQVQVLFKDTNGQYMKLSNMTTDLTISQGAFDTKRTILSLPVSYYAGNPFEFVVLIKDSYSNCFEDEFDINQISASLNVGSTQYSDFVFTQENLDFSVCNRIIKVKTPTLDSPLKNSGEYKLDILINQQVVNYVNIQVLPNKLSPIKSTFTVTGMGAITVAQIKAGTTIEIQMAGTDLYGNPVSYYDISERLNLNIDGLVRDSNYTFSSRIDEQKSKVLMYLTVNTLGRYKLNYTIDSLNFDNQNGLKEIIVTPGLCSNTYPNINVPFTNLYSGDYGQIIIKCLDDFNNTISVKGDERFNIEIKGRNLEIVGEDKLPYEFNFNSGDYSAKFLLAYNGIYDVSIYLNGHRYGSPFVINVLPQKCNADAPIMCSDKKCVKTISECTIDTDIYNCPEPEKSFYCNVKGEKKCVGKTSECDCSSGYNKCNGMCLPAGSINYCEKPITINCQRKLGIENFISCPDGSCRTANSRCPNPLGCPLGYKPCGVGCIKRSDSCTVVAPLCSSSQVQCWDLSCADSLDSCPIGKTCKNVNDVVCPDGKCQLDQTQCTQPPSCNSAFSFLCPDFSCKKSAADCNKRPVCFPGQSLCEDNSCSYDCSKSNTCASDKFLCPTGQCVQNILICPTPISCPPGSVKCPSGTCASNFALCKFVSTSNSLSCPLESPILCPDLSCVTDASLCSILTACPNHAPFRCPNNECRLSKENCPSTPVCPTEYPVLCSDGTCQKASYHCTKSENKHCDKVRCSDGTCVASLSMCPNQVTCGINQIKCWDGACVNTIKDCRDPKYINCPIDLPFRCSDGSCRKDKLSCSTVSICPTDKPIKCYDNSCREHLSLCPAYQNCGKNMKSCPDGTCSNDRCNTVVTCSTSMPFLCYDNTCKTDIRDCPNPPTCHSGILCPDGSCVSNRQLCKFFDPCPPSNPVRCQQGSCASSVDDCYATIRECPIGFFKCKTGGCRTNEALCDNFSCPSNIPYLCKEGTCAEKESYCDNPTTGCPYNLPHKCLDGTCVTNTVECFNYSKITCAKEFVLCTDGSCRRSYEDCPLQNGCTKEKPLKCSDGICIDPITSSCSPPTCPFDSPIKCQSGECVATSANCPSSVKEKDYKDCEEIGFPGLYMCADGRCVPSTDHCKALYKCPVGFLRCSDGTCKISSSLCPTVSNCPLNRSIRCPFGKCVVKNSECYSNMVCPPEYSVRCEKTGECVKDSASCPGMENTSNGCNKETPFKCLDGRCMALEEQCNSVNIACTDETPVLCLDGTCKENRVACEGIRDTCQEGYERCPDGTCVEKNTSWQSCRNKIGCPLVKPIRCTDGSCVEDSKKCKTSIACNSYNPVLCADMSCKADSKFCNVVYPCPDKTPYRCGNGYCSKDETECKELSGLCPMSSPFKCNSGRCVSNIMDCSLEYYVETCKDNEFFCAATSSCVNGAAACLGSNMAAGVKPGSSRILQTTPSTKPIPENGCSEITPYSCYDGTCRTKREECPLLPACNALEYRCASGSCNKDPSQCRENSVVCEQGLNKCEDGLCRKECPQYNGCGLAAPFQCTNGMCVKNILECIGYSMCSPSQPFRCVDGLCVSDPNACVNIKRLNSPKRMTMAVSKFNEINIPVVYDRNRRNIAKIIIPGNSIVFKNSSSLNYTNIIVDEIPHSVLYTSSVNYNNSDILTYNISNGIPSSDGVLNFENSVLSPVFKISGENLEDGLKHLARIYIEHNYYILSKFLISDYCLAKLVDNKWMCVDRKTSDEQTTFTFNSFGIYAVVLNPLRDAIALNPEDVSSFFYSNIQTFVIILAILFLISLIIFYIFTRVIRYREKYKDNKEKMVNLQNQMDEYKNMTTDVPGQTLGDNIAGIVFTKNPAHSVTSVTKGSVLDLENEIEDLQRKCRTIESQNKTIEEKIQDATEQYRLLKMEIDRMKR